MNSMRGVTDELAEYSSRLRYDDLPADVVEKTKQLILDLFGNAICAARDAESTPSIVAATVMSSAPGVSTVIGQTYCLSPGDAAFVNGALAHSLDFDDTHRNGSVHPGASAIPLALAIGEDARKDGRQLIAAVVAGYDVTCRLAVALGAKNHYDLGFHPTGTAGVFGATAAGGNLLGLDAATISSALGINGSQAAGSLQFFDNGAWNKRIHPGLAARSAVTALNLARSGFLGASRAIEGTNGFLRGYSGNPRPREATRDLGQRFEVLATAIKPYPACRYAHAPLDSIVRLVKEHDLRPSEIERVRIGLSDAGVDLIGRPVRRKRNPQNVVDGQFSLPFLAAVALARRRMTWDDYELIGDPAIRRLISRIEVSPDTRATRAFPKRWLSVVEIWARGRVYRDVNWRARGEPEAPLSWDEVIAKFDGLTSPSTRKARQGLVDGVRNLDQLDDIRDVGELLRACTLGPAN
jgi:2-methylcitrate dehydratase PrpD